MKVIIVGAGISGLTLAAALAQLAPRIEVEIFERDATAAERPEGLCHRTKGRFGPRRPRATRAEGRSPGHRCSADNEFRDHRSGGRYAAGPSSGNDGPRQTYRVQRDHLQSVIAAALATTRVQYGYQALGYEALADRFRVVFTGGRHVDGDVVIAADGVGSALRRQLVDDSPHFLGLSAINGDAALSSEDPLLSGATS